MVDAAPIIRIQQLGNFVAMKRFMGLDVGDARIGVALSDPLGLTAQPYTTVDRRGGREISEFSRIVAKEDVGVIVIGLPLELSGEAGPQAEKVRLFAEHLERSLQRSEEISQKPKIELWDERLTTVEAERVIRGSGLKDRERRATLDRISAAVILASYLAARPA